MKSFLLIAGTFAMVAAALYSVAATAPHAVRQPMGIGMPATAETLERNRVLALPGVAPTCAPHCVWVSEESAPKGKRHKRHKRHKWHHH